MTGAPPIPSAPYTGLMERVKGNGIDILCGAGVGGSSLLYHGMTLQPDGEQFARSVSARIDYDLLDREYFPRVARTLHLATIPDDLLHHDRFMLLADFDSYVETQDLVDAAFRDRGRWTRSSILNVARCGYFSSDRSVREYAEKIWKL